MPLACMQGAEGPPLVGAAHTIDTGAPGFSSAEAAHTIGTGYDRRAAQNLLNFQPSKLRFANLKQSHVRIYSIDQVLVVMLFKLVVFLLFRLMFN